MSAYYYTRYFTHVCSRMSYVQMNNRLTIYLLCRCPLLPLYHKQQPFFSVKCPNEAISILLIINYHGHVDKIPLYAQPFALSVTIVRIKQ